MLVDVDLWSSFPKEQLPRRLLAPVAPSLALLKKSSHHSSVSFFGPQRLSLASLPLHPSRVGIRVPIQH